jgi:2-phospho-L-lactate guanylyltransferase (CobY/MobA/RfbA family)
MSQTIELNEELKKLIKSSIREVLEEERVSLIQALIPFVSKKEMADIVKRYGKPSDYSEQEFVDKTNWLIDEN